MSNRAGATGIPYPEESAFCSEGTSVEPTGAEVLLSDGRPPRLTRRAIMVMVAGVAIIVLIGVAVLVWRHKTTIPVSPVALSSGGDFQSTNDSDPPEYRLAFPVLNFLREPVEIGGLEVRAPSDRVESAIVTSAGFERLNDPSRVPPAATVIPPGGSVNVVILMKPSCAAPSHFTSVWLRYRTSGHSYRTQFLDPPTIAKGEDAFASLAKQVCPPA